MNWEDTVMKENQMVEVARECWRTEHTYPELVARRQAKLAWEARQKEVDEAEQRGIKKVVDWIKDNNFNLKGMDNYVDFGIDSQKWQAFLKELKK